MGFTTNIINNLFSRVIKIVITFFISILVARALGPEGNGEASYLIMIFSFIGTYCHLGINDSLAYFMRKSKYDEESVLNNNLSILYSLALLITVIVFIIYKYKLVLVEYNIYEIAIGIVLFISILLNNFTNAFFSVHNRFIEFNKILVNLTFVKLILTVVLFFIGKLNVLTYLIIYTLDFTVATALAFFSSNIKFKFKINVTMTKDQLMYGFAKFIAGLIMFLNYRVDQFMIKFYLGMYDFGLYAVSVKLAELVLLIPSSIEWVLLSFLLNSNESEGKVKTIETVKSTFYICTFMSIAGVICAPLITLLYGDEYRTAISAFIILLIGVVFVSVGKLCATYYFSKGDTKTQFYLTSLMLSINVVGNAILLPKIGINGAAIASTLSYFVYGIGYIIILWKRDKVSVAQLFKLSKKDIVSYLGQIRKK